MNRMQIKFYQNLEVIHRQVDAAINSMYQLDKNPIEINRINNFHQLNIIIKYH